MSFVGYAGEWLKTPFSLLKPLHCDVASAIVVAEYPLIRVVSRFKFWVGLPFLGGGGGAYLRRRLLNW